ncbi:hypothetical protein [Anaerocolumna chitinilytica]|uniref:Uncharacterized protein n=1 Tax=Anaerocolumna chitinilytica TaxID=1727145 RepID=A0A7M3SAK8_9FIRM|nr:hypothetical protein [Anaerocolumna chitinilytica]BCK01626.1 hypothetical protein bsdcttw_46660 [Anaerocolumna chitinilytica]
MKKKPELKEPEVKICSYCGIEVIGSYQYIKTKRGSELYICSKCVNEVMKTAKR